MSSMRRARTIPKSKPPPLPAFLVPIEQAPKPRRPYGKRSVVTSVEGRVLTPQGMLSQVITSENLPDTLGSHSAVLYPMEGDEETELGGDDELAVSKKKKQWRRWAEEVIPSMIEPYLDLLYKTSGLRNMHAARGPHGCLGCGDGHKKEILCVYFERIEKIVLCSCTPIALQLLARGLFPCAPLEPSLAVDLNVLDLAKELFVNAAPNTTAWCETLEGFLNSRRFKLSTRDSLRGRFGNAMLWYSTLINKKKLMMRNYLDSIRATIIDVQSGHGNAAGVAGSFDMAEMEVDSEAFNTGSNPNYETEIPMEDIPEADTNLDRPSEYLRERCPLCFGGENWSKPVEVVDAIVCLDACFTQKRRKTDSKAWQGPRVHPETVFIPTEEVLDMESFVESVRAKKPTVPKPSAPTNQPAEDDYEPRMKVPTSVLNECNDSFLAADERRTKASTTFFSDTGVMALLCRHDRVLWLANMTSAGEKQHYALCLLGKLFANIPEKMRIGVLYDIGCQIHRSCEKHDFFPEYRDRIVFGISVFHAYGHQWPCQIIYHPRKCEGFGLTDGEGCERFWSSIKRLIPSCRVSSYFNRIYTLDTQVRHLDEKSLLGLGQWLRRKWLSTASKKKEVSAILDSVYATGITEAELREEWKAQVVEQTKPLKRQSKHLADKELQEILVLSKSLEEFNEEIGALENMIITGTYSDGHDLYSAQATLEELEGRAKKVKSSITYKRGKLTVDERANLQRLKGNEFLRLRMNALALKQRIRDRLRNRKFEMENLERAYRNTVNHSKLEKHASQQIKRKEPGIQALARNYNKLCGQLSELIQKRKAPRGAIAPVAIVYDGLFKLDVDDEIWQDIGLTEDGEGSVNVPGWLGNEDIRRGIKALLEFDRCSEEERRLKQEVISMHQWFREEWAVVERALVWSRSDGKLAFQLEEKRNHLLRLVFTWKPKVAIIPVVLQETWGPSEEDWWKIKEYELRESVEHGSGYMEDSDKDYDTMEFEEDDDSLDWSDEDVEGLHDAELIDSLEHMIVH